LFLGGLRPQGNHHHFGGNALFLKTYRFFNSDFTEGVDGHFDIGQVNGAAIGFGAHFDVVINDTFYGDEYLHE